jgi:hypothetical protein
MAHTRDLKMANPVYFRRERIEKFKIVARDVTSAGSASKKIARNGVVLGAFELFEQSLN